jgi:hypothetical protein
MAGGPSSFWYEGAMNMNLKKMLMVVALAVVATACGPMKFMMQGTTLATGADAELVADVNADTSVTMVTFVAKNLAPPARVKEGSTSFVVWQRKNTDVQWVRVSPLMYDEGGRIGKLEGVSIPEAAFDFLVTCEATNDPATPSPEVIFSQRVQKK